jgi:hypothetical protein
VRDITDLIPHHDGFRNQDLTESTPTSGRKSAFVIGRKAAAIVETRPMTNLVPLILHYRMVLGPEWPIILFTNNPDVSSSSVWIRALESFDITVRPIPPTANFTTMETVSSFLTTTWLWEQLAPADNVLLFQSDTIICANAPQRLEDFMGYDFVGAPISNEWGEAYNGGLSLRNRKMMVEIATKYNFTQELLDGTTDEPNGLPINREDQWFYKKMLKLRNEDGSPAARFPTENVARTFSVQTVFFAKPLGYHQVRRFQPNKMDVVERWCPEFRLSSENSMA